MVFLLSPLNIIIYLLFSSVSTVPSPIWTHYETEVTLLAIKAINQLLNQTNETILDSEINKKGCLNIIAASLSNNNISNIFYNSGHGLMRLGNQRECESEGFTYHLLKIGINSTFLDNMNEDLNEFIGMKTYKIGFCIFKECDDWMTFLLNTTVNRGFYHYVKDAYSIDTIDKVYQLPETKFYSFLFLICIFTIVPWIIFIFCFKCIHSIFLTDEDDTDCYDDDKNERKKDKSNFINEIQENSGQNQQGFELVEQRLINNKNNDDSDEKEEEESSKSWFNSMSKDSKSIQNKKIEQVEKYLNKVENCNNSTSNNTNGNKSFFQNFFISVTDWCIMKISHNNWFILNNQVRFNENRLEILSGLRSFIMILITVHRVCISFYEFPTTSYGNMDFYNSLNITIIKLSSFSTSCWIYWDGFLYCYKFWFYIKNENNQISKWKVNNKINVTYGMCLKFLSHCLFPKLFVFVLVIILVLLNWNDYALVYGNTYWFIDFYNTKYNSECMKKPYWLVIPFYFSYFRSEDKCFAFVTQIVNEFYCICFVIFLLGTLIKIKNLKFDYLVILLFVFNISLSFFSYDISLLKYTLNEFLNEQTTLKYPHLMWNIFFLGSLNGIIYFYYIESISNFQTFSKTSIYYPFRFLFNLMALLTKIRKIPRYLIMVIGFLIQIQISWIYPIMKRRANNETKYIFEFTSLWSGIYIYEKVIFVFAYGIMTLMILFSSDKFWIKILLRGKIFITIGRVSFAFLLLDEIFVYLFFTWFDLSGFFWNYQNIIYVSSVWSILMLFIAEMITVYLEIPVRILMKNSRDVGKRGKIEETKDLFFQGSD